MKNDRSYYTIITLLGDQEFDYLQTSLLDFKTYLNRTTIYVNFTPEYLGRLDKLSYDVYGTTKLWWAIALANDIDDPFDDSKLDTRLRIPDILDILDFFDANYVVKPTE